MSGVLVRRADEQTHVHPDPIAVKLAAVKRLEEI
jgi:hypothetical protein